MKLFKKIILQEKEVTFQIKRAIKCPPTRLKLICNKDYCDANPEFRTSSYTFIQKVRNYNTFGPLNRISES